MYGIIAAFVLGYAGMPDVMWAKEYIDFQRGLNGSLTTPYKYSVSVPSTPLRAVLPLNYQRPSMASGNVLYNTYLSTLQHRHLE
jgi:hypothetical protein